MPHSPTRSGPVRRLPLLLVAALALVATVLAVPVGASPAPAGHVNADAQQSGHYPHTGPGSATVRWQTEMVGHGFNENFEHSGSLIDSFGQLIVHLGGAELGDETALAALDPASGAVRWVAEGYSAQCHAVASANGTIFASAIDREEIVELDAATGAPTGRVAALDPDDSLVGCLRLLLAPDGTLLVPGNTRLYGFDTTTPNLDVRLRVDDASGVVLSPDGSTIYDGEAVPGGVAVRALRLADGSERDRVTVPRPDDFMVWRLRATPAGVLVDTLSHLAHIRDDGTSLSVAWELDGAGGGGGYSVTPHRVIGSVVGSILARDLATGSFEWDAAVDAPRVVTDTAGNSYLGGDAGLTSLDPQGAVRWTLPASAVQGGATFDIGPIAPEGTLYAVAYRPGEGFDPAEPPIVLAVRDQPAPPPGGGRIGASEDPIAAAISISQATFPDASAGVVVVGRSDVFADNLAGTALAGTRGPLLLTEGGPEGRLPQAVADEAARVLGPRECQAGDPPDVYILGGPNAVSTATGEGFAAGGYCVARLAGPTRVETSLAIAQALAGQATDRLLLARSDDWADSATGGAYAAATGTPIVVTPTSGLTQSVHDFLGAHQIGEIVLLGGPVALSDDVAEQASAYAPVRRVAGVSRDATAVEIAQQLWGDLAAAGATLVPGFADDGWTYALTGGVRAAVDGWPELYTQQDSLTQTTRDWLAEHADDVLVVGPTSRISDDVAAEAAAVAGGGSPGSGTAPYAYTLWGQDVRYVDAAGSERVLGAGAVTGNLTWAPDGQAVAVIMGDGHGEGPDGPDEAGDLVVLGLDGEASVDLQSTYGTGGLAFRDPVWSPSQDRMAVLGVDDDPSVVLYERAVGGETAGSLYPLTSPDDGFAGLGSPQAWSPDGSRIAFTLSGELAIVDRTTLELERLGVQALDPAWSPDGEAIAYTFGVSGSTTFVLELDDPANPVPIGEISGQRPLWLDDSTILLAGEHTTTEQRAVWQLYRDGSPADVVADLERGEILADAAADGSIAAVFGELGATVLDPSDAVAFDTTEHVTDLRFQPNGA